MDEKQIIKIAIHRIKPIPITTLSLFNPSFDQQLSALVVKYRFNFEAIAIHLMYLFPQYEYKINAKSVSHRWTQIHQASKYPLVKPSPSLPTSQHRQLPPLKPRNSQEKYQIALEMAKQLDEEQNNSFIIYRPKFIIDNQFKLQRQQCNINKLNSFINNNLSFDFGSFDNNGQFAGPIPNNPSMNYQQIDVNYDIDDDWQAYQSD